MSLERSYSHIIVGGGSAGCVLASRLSARSSNHVLLLEAGRDTAPDDIEPEILDSYPRIAYFNEKNLWADLRVSFDAADTAARNKASLRRYEQARLMGGGSSLNDMQANRGIPADYEDWVIMGASGWGWQDVLPYFRRLERDIDFDGPLHGREGPIPIRRIQPSVWPGFSRAVAAALQQMGYSNIEDQNAVFDDGYFPVAISNIYDRRVSSAIGYLDNSVRRRPNLCIQAHSCVSGLLIEAGRAAGVTVTRAEQTEIVRGKEIIVTCGAIHTPAMLMRAGIGPADHLRGLGIPVVANRSGVGRNLLEHPAISVSAFLRRRSRLGEGLRRHTHVGLRYSSEIDGCPSHDMYMVALSKSGWHPVGKQIGSLVTWVNKTYSTGEVLLLSASHEEEPDVRFRLLSDQRDLDRLLKGMRKMINLCDQEALRDHILERFPSSYSERIRDLGKVSTKNLLSTSVLALALDGPDELRKAMIRHVVTEGASLSDLGGSNDLLTDFIRQKVHGVWHAAGTCRMGASSDEFAVTDPSGKVFGVGDLRIADASLMPTLPRANTNIPTIMIAEKISDHILNA